MLNLGSSFINLSLFSSVSDAEKVSIILHYSMKQSYPMVDG
jgi:hypothetical protein